MLNEFKNFTVDRLQIDDLVTLAAFGRILRAEYEAQKVEEPEFIDINLKTLRREIQSRQADQTEKRRRHIKASLESLKTPAEKRAALEAELQALEAVNA